MNLFVILASYVYLIGFAIWFLILFAQNELLGWKFYFFCVPWPLTTPVIVIGGYFFHRKERRRHYLSRYRLGRREFRHVMNASIDDLVREQEERNAAEGIVV